MLDSLLAKSPFAFGLAVLSMGCTSGGVAEPHAPYETGGMSQSQGSGGSLGAGSQAAHDEQPYHNEEGGSGAAASPRGTSGAGGTNEAGGALRPDGQMGTSGAPGAPAGTGGAGKGRGVGGSAGSKSSEQGGNSAGGPQGTGGTTVKGGAGGSASGGSAAGGSAAGSSANGGSAGAPGIGRDAASACPGATQTLAVGSGQPYSTVQAAIDAISSTNSKLVAVSVKAGKYKEQVTINKPFVCLVGESATTTVITNALGTNIVTGGTVIVSGNDFSSAHIAFENTGGDGSGQAVALMAEGQRQQFYDCRFLSYQDTLYVNKGTQYFRDSYIQGDTDYIFGDATTVFDNCTMNSVAEGTAVTAPRTPQGTTYGFVFLGGALTASPTTSTVRANHVYLGRPWGPYAAAAFLDVAMGAHVASDGWTTMSDNTLAKTRFSEYKSSGAGANPTNATRASRQLSDAEAAKYTVKNVLSPWVPSYSQ